MKVTFDFEPQTEGYRLTMKCSEMTELESGAFDREEYYQCFKAIQKEVEGIITMQEEHRKAMAV